MPDTPTRMFAARLHAASPSPSDSKGRSPMYLWTAFATGCLMLATAGGAMAYKHAQNEREHEAEMAKIRRAYATYVVAATEAIDSSQFVTGGRIVEGLTAFHQVEALPIADSGSLKTIRAFAAIRSVEAITGAPLPDELAAAIRLAVFNESANQGDDLLKETLELGKEIACGLNSALNADISPGSRHVENALLDIEAVCGQLMVEPALSGPLPSDCIAMELDGLTIAELAYASCEEACAALEAYCDGDKIGAQCSLNRLDGVVVALWDAID